MAESDEKETEKSNNVISLVYDDSKVPTPGRKCTEEEGKKTTKGKTPSSEVSESSNSKGGKYKTRRSSKAAADTEEGIRSPPQTDKEEVCD